MHTFTRTNCLRCAKTVGFPSFSGPYFSAFGLNTEIYGVYMDQRNSEYGHFFCIVLCAVNLSCRILTRFITLASFYTP